MLSPSFYSSVTLIFSAPSSTLPPRCCSCRISLLSSTCLPPILAKSSKISPHCMCPSHIFPLVAPAAFLTWPDQDHTDGSNNLSPLSEERACRTISLNNQHNNKASSVQNTLQRTTWFPFFFFLLVPCLHKKLQFHLIVQHQRRQVLC